MACHRVAIHCAFSMTVDLFPTKPPAIPSSARRVTTINIAAFNGEITSERAAFVLLQFHCRDSFVGVIRRGSGARVCRRWRLVVRTGTCEVRDEHTWCVRAYKTLCACVYMPFAHVHVRACMRVWVRERATGKGDFAYMSRRVVVILGPLLPSPSRTQRGFG